VTGKIISHPAGEQKLKYGTIKFITICYVYKKSYIEILEHNLLNAIATTRTLE
jgi:hypothetical protein